MSTTTSMFDLNSSGTTLAFNLTNGTTTTEAPSKSLADFWIGLILAVSSSFFNGSSFIFQKVGLKSMRKKDGATTASAGGHRYLLEWKWWLGMLMMALGEGCNFVAFTFAPATLVTPLGALSVIFCAILASRFLKERLNLLGKAGCLLCVLGSTVTVVHSPKTAQIQHMSELLDKVKQPAILTVVGVFILVAIVAIVILAPRWGEKNVAVYVFICSVLGALTVTGAKGFGVALNQTFKGDQQFTNWLTYVMLGVVIVDILFQLHFLNKALDLFNTAIVTPTYYVMFTTAVAILSLTLYQEFNSLSVFDIIGNVCGFLIIVVGIFLLNAFKDMDITLKNLPKAKKPSTDVNVLDGTKMPAIKRDNDLFLELNENESEDEDEDLLQCHDSPVFVVDDPLDKDAIDFRTPRRKFFAGKNGHVSNGHVSNGHVDHLHFDIEKYMVSAEVTHF